MTRDRGPGARPAPRIRDARPDETAAAVVARAEGEGRDVHVVPGGSTRRETLDLFAQSLGLPDWFGHNLDALADCLHELALEASEPVELVWDGVAALEASDAATYAGVRSVLAEVAEEHEDFHVTVVHR